MSTDAQNLFAAFNALPEAEQIEFASKVAAVLPNSSGQVDENELDVADRQIKMLKKRINASLGSRNPQKLTSGEDTLASPNGFQTPEEWSKAFREWASNQDHYNPDVDCSRESIYGDRGL